jgi:multidrug efflux pump subunit AcrA (membrane-fusion protein)
MKRRLLFPLLIVCLAIAAALGFLAGRSVAPSPAPPGASGTAAPPVAKQVWTCSMHPQVRLDRPGDCPICEMPLIPADSAQGSGDGPPMLTLSDHALAMASVETVVIERRPLSREVLAVGKIEYNESALATITPRVDGYAERLFVNFTGIEINAGDHLAEVYSPELLIAQQELLIALQGGSNGPLVETARTKLRLLGLTDAQIADLVENKRMTDRVTLFSPISGTVIEKTIVEHAAFSAGDALYRIANLDSVWVYLEIYELELPWIRYGQRVRITAEALPGREFEGLVTFVQPIVNETTRTVRVPVHIENPDHVLKPGMFVSTTIFASLSADGRAAPTGVEGRYSCPMHPQILRDEGGPCPACGMPLEQIPGSAAGAPPSDEHAGHGAAAQSHAASNDAGANPVPAATRYFCPMKCEGEKTYDQPGRCPVCNMRLREVTPEAAQDGQGPDPTADLVSVPVSAVLDSGTRRIVYIERSRGTFEPREVTLGPRAGGYYPVLNGLEVGERVVTRGNFLIDSQFQVTGHPSLLYPGGLHAAPPHQHGATEGPGPTQPPTPPPSTTGHNH